LGPIIPLSQSLILLSDIMQLSVGTLFAARCGPGMLLAAVYIYLVIMGWIKPETMPIPYRRRDTVFAPTAHGVIVERAAPTEAASMGTSRCGDHAALSGPLHLKTLKDTAMDATKSTAIMMFIPHDGAGVLLAFRAVCRVKS
jgi:TRAP-type mannitol/chloroaromatic compound transport system permease large subunit